MPYKSHAKKMENNKKWRTENPEKHVKIQTTYRKAHLQKWRDVAKSWRERYPDKVRAYKRKWAAANRDKTNEMQRQKRLWFMAIPFNRIRHLTNLALWRGKRRGLPTDEDLVETLTQRPNTHCLCCGIEFDYSTGRGLDKARSPSLDRVDSTLGYTGDNVQIICQRCNMIKRDATADELRAVADYIDHHKPRAVHG